MTCWTNPGTWVGAFVVVAVEVVRPPIRLANQVVDHTVGAAIAGLRETIPERVDACHRRDYPCVVLEVVVRAVVLLDSRSSPEVVEDDLGRRTWVALPVVDPAVPRQEAGAPRIVDSTCTNLVA